METLRPLSISELLDRSFTLYREHFVLFVLTTAIPQGVVALFQLLLTASASLNSAPLVILIALALYVAMIVASLVTQGVTFVAVSQVQLGQPTSAMEAFARIRGRLGELVIIALNVGVRIMLGFLLLIVPGVIWALRYALVMPVAVLEETGVAESLERSRELTRGHLGRIFLIYVLLIVLLIVGGAAWGLLMRALVVIAPSAADVPAPLWVRTLDVVGKFVVNSLLGAIPTIGLALVYYDERVRKEGFDLEHMMRQLDSTDANSSIA